MLARALVVASLFLVAMTLFIWAWMKRKEGMAYHKAVSYGAERASRHLMMLSMAEENFRRAGFNGPKYAWNIQALYETKDFKGIPIRLIPAELADGIEEGYCFGALPTSDAVGGKDSRFGFAYYALPEAYPETDPTCIINQVGQVWVKDTSAKPPEGWPQDPLKEGWVAVKPFVNRRVP